MKTSTFHKLLLPLALALPILTVGCSASDYTPTASMPGSSSASASEVAPTPSQPALQDLTFALTNATNYPLVRFYASPTKLNDWEEDILGEDVLIPGYQTNIVIADGRSTCIYDIKSVFQDGDELIEEGVDLCRLHEGTYTLVEN